MSFFRETGQCDDERRSVKREREQTMSLDKFGRSCGSDGGGGGGGDRKRLFVKGPRGIGFNLTDDGDYDMDDRRLTRVGDAESETDAVNAAGLNRALKEQRIAARAEYEDLIVHLSNDVNAKLTQHAKDTSDSSEKHMTFVESRLDEQSDRFDSLIDELSAKLSNHVKNSNDSSEKHRSFVESRLNEQSVRFASLIDELSAKLTNHVVNSRVFERSVNETVYGKQHVRLHSTQPEIIFSETRDEYVLEDEPFAYAFPYDDGFVSDWTFESPTDARIYVDGEERKREEIKELKKGAKLTFKPSESALKKGVGIPPPLNVSFVVNYPIVIKTTHSDS